MSELQANPREAWIDISRFIAACLIVYVHVPNYSFSVLFQMPVYDGRVSFFLILAGYFLGRNNTWHKAINRAYTLFIPLVIWNVIISLFHKEIWDIGFGEYCGNILLAKYAPTTWFLRDIIILSLFSPLFMKFKVLGYALIVFIFATNGINTSLLEGAKVCAPMTCAVFWLGLYLSGIDLQRFRNLFSYTGPRYMYVTLAIGALIGITNYLCNVSAHPDWPMYKLFEPYGAWKIEYPQLTVNVLAPLLGAVLLMVMGMFIEQKFPKARKLSNYAPACFLIFVLNYPIVRAIPEEIWKSSLWLPFVLVPIIIAAIVGFYLLLRKLCPSWLPYIANDRVTKTLPKKTNT